MTRPAGYTFSDAYILLVCVCLTPFSGIVWLISGVVVLPWLTIVNIYRHVALGSEVGLVERNTWFWVAVVTSTFMGVPFFAIGIVWAAFVCVATFLLCIPAIIWSPGRVKRSLYAANLYMGRPGSNEGHNTLSRLYGYMWAPSDLFVGAVGVMDRQGFLEVWIGAINCVAFVPMIKYCIAVNPWILDLRQVFINQWSHPYEVSDIYDKTRQHVCAAILPPNVAATTDDWEFSGFHQFPPPDRESGTVAGLQFLDMRVIHRAILISHTSHGCDARPGSSHEGLSQHACHARKNVIAVHIQAWNPFYFVAGYVEVNVRSDQSMEHPMWLCADPENSMLGFSILESIDSIFVKLGNEDYESVLKI